MNCLCVKNDCTISQPITIVEDPMTILPPWAVMSPTLAAGSPPISTVAEPAAMMSGGPEQVQKFVAVAAGILSIKTVGTPGGKMGPPACGTVPVTIGQTCMSPTLAAGIPMWVDV